MTAIPGPGQWRHPDGSACTHRFFCWRTASQPPPETPAAALERLLYRVDEYEAWLLARAAAIHRDHEFLGYCIADVADSVRILGEWPVLAGRCQHKGCGELLVGSVENHVRACHWADYQAMRAAFSPPGWHETTPGRWSPDQEGVTP